MLNMQLHGLARALMGWHKISFHILTGKLYNNTLVCKVIYANLMALVTWGGVNVRANIHHGYIDVTSFEFFRTNYNNIYYIII